MFLSSFLVILGIAILIKWADWLVDGASSLAKRFNISDLVIGLTIVAFGTSTPELVVNIVWSLSHANDLVLGNIIGSNIANLWLILGIVAIIKENPVALSTRWQEIPLATLSAIVLAVLVNDRIFANNPDVLSMGDGIILLGFFAIFMYYIFFKSTEHHEPIQQPKSLTLAIVLFLWWLAALVFGGKLTVDHLLVLAQHRWWSEKLIGLTILAVGTSLPELVTSITAALKSETNIAIGNIIGSNIFNVFFVLGITSIVSPVQFNIANNIDISMNIAIHIILFIFLFIWHKGYLQRRQGVIMILSYVGYIGYMV